MQLELIATKPITEKELILNYLQKKWASNFEVICYVKSASADRRIRELQEKGLLLSRDKEAIIGGRKKRWKEYKAK